MTPPCSLAQALAATGPLLLDFDWPICAVFATVAPATVAEQLRQVLTEHGTLIPQHIATQTDPMEVLRRPHRRPPRRRPRRNETQPRARTPGRDHPGR